MAHFRPPTLCYSSYTLPTYILLQGFAQFTIEGSDDFNGVIGFHVAFLYATINEDTDPTTVLTLDRGEAYFDNVMVSMSVTK